MRECVFMNVVLATHKSCRLLGATCSLLLHAYQMLQRNMSEEEEKTTHDNG